MDKEQQKYQKIGLTLRSIYDAVESGILTAKEFTSAFVAALPDWPKNIVEDVLVLLEKGAETDAMKAISRYIYPSSEDLEKRKGITAAFVAGLSGQPIEEISANLDVADIIREADAEYADYVSSNIDTTPGGRVKRDFQLGASERGLLDAAYEKYKADGDTEALLDVVTSIELKDLGTPSITDDSYFARYASEYAPMTFYGLQDDVQLKNYREAAGNNKLTPLYNFGLAPAFLAGLAPERIIEIQTELMEAGFLQPGSYVMGTIGEIGTPGEDATIQALEAAFSYLNTKPEYGIDIDDLKEINAAANGDEGAFLGFLINYFVDSISEISLRDTNPILTAPTLLAQANPDFLKFNVNQTVRDTIGANPSVRDYQVIYDWAGKEIERLSAAYAESQKIYEQARVDVAKQAAQDKLAGTEQDYYLLPPSMSDADVSAAFSTGLDEFVYNYFKPLIDQGKQDVAYQQGLGVAIASLTK